MIPKALQLVFFWRRNHLPSIAFKCAMWGSIAWTCVSVFTTNQLAFVAAIIVSAMSAAKYGLRNLQQAEKLRQLCEGDPLKLAELKATMNTRGVAGALMRELLNADINDDQHGEFGAYAPPSADELAKNKYASTQLIKKMARLTQASGLVAKDQCIELQTELLNMYSSGEYKIAIDELVSEFLPNNVMCIYTSDYVDDDDHASLVDSFSAATNGLWKTTDCRSHFDQSNQQWIVTFKEDGVEKLWQFKQSKTKGLSKSFLQQIISYTEEKTDYVFSVLGNNNVISLVCLPSGMYANLIEVSEDMAA